ncbi:D-alanyl-D-alanine carboxypeptidase family protein [bacterium]|nr:D-alanyl-D-alanine carboxypeptidase family protein [bacterium]
METIHLRYEVCPTDSLIRIPEDLCRDHGEFMCHIEAILPLRHLIQLAETDGVDIVVISAFRSFEYQQTLFEDAERRYGPGRGSTWVAPPGHSEHHTGFCFDLADRHCPECDDEPGFENTPAAKWLLNNANMHGFELSFPPQNWQGVGYEPWHWRYVESPLSTQIFSSKNIRP